MHIEIYSEGYCSGSNNFYVPPTTCQGIIQEIIDFQTGIYINGNILPVYFYTGIGNKDDP